MWKQDMFELLVTHIKNGTDEVDILEKLQGNFPYSGIDAKKLRNKIRERLRKEICHKKDPKKKKLRERATN